MTSRLHHTEDRQVKDAATYLFTQETAQVTDRHRLRDVEQRAKMLQESERLSKILLDSVSHELRTPIAVITGAANALKEACDLSLARVP